MRYKLVHRYNIPELELEVVFWIKKGWTPLGGVAIYGGSIVQTMIHEEQKVGTPAKILRTRRSRRKGPAEASPKLAPL